MKKRFGCDNPFTIYGVGGDAQRFVEREARRKADIAAIKTDASSEDPRSSKKDPRKTEDPLLQVMNSRAGLRDGTLLAFITGSQPGDVDTAECIIEKLTFALYHSLGSARPVYRVQLKIHLPEICKEESSSQSFFERWKDAAGKWKFTQWIAGKSELELLDGFCPSWTCRSVGANGSDLAPEEGHVVDDAMNLVNFFFTNNKK